MRRQEPFRGDHHAGGNGDVEPAPAEVREVGVCPNLTNDQLEAGERCGCEACREYGPPEGWREGSTDAQPFAADGSDGEFGYWPGEDRRDRRSLGARKGVL